jgi:D-amino-acid dehydrogenase
VRVIVIGAGLAGTTTAWYLRDGGADVTVVDRACGAAMETSFANAGMLTPSMADPWNAPGTFWHLLRWIGREDAPMLLRPGALPGLAGWGISFLRHSRPGPFRRNTVRNVRLAVYSLSELRALRDGLGLQYDGAARGTLRACRDRASLDRASSLAASLAEHGVAFRRLDTDGVIDVEPALAPVASKIVGGVHYQGDESGDAHLFTTRLAERAADQGVNFRFGFQVRSIETRDGTARGIRGRYTDSQADETIEADALVLAAGSYTPLLGQGVGVRVPVRPVKGYSITAPRGDWDDGPRIPVSDDHLHTAVTPLGDRIRVAGTAEFTGYDDRLTPARVQNLLDLLREIYPDYARRLDPATVKPWCGFRPVSSDGVPILGPTPVPGLFLNTGHGPLGWTMAAGCGRLVADRVLGEKCAIDLEDYALDRF